MEWWQPALFGVLPACFAVMALVTYRMDRQIVELRSQLQAIERAVDVERIVAHLPNPRPRASR